MLSIISLDIKGSLIGSAFSAMARMVDNDDRGLAILLEDFPVSKLSDKKPNDQLSSADTNVARCSIQMCHISVLSCLRIGG